MTGLVEIVYSRQDNINNGLVHHKNIPMWMAEVSMNVRQVYSPRNAMVEAAT